MIQKKRLGRLWWVNVQHWTLWDYIGSPLQSLGFISSRRQISDLPTGIYDQTGHNPSTCWLYYRLGSPIAWLVFEKTTILWGTLWYYSHPHPYSYKLPRGATTCLYLGGCNEHSSPSLCGFYVVLELFDVGRLVNINSHPISGWIYTVPVIVKP